MDESIDLMTEYTQKRIPVLGITGQVGAGKSTVLEYLEKTYGAAVLMLDALAASLQKKGGCCYGPMIELFGTQVVRGDGEFDRAKIAGMVFSDPPLLQKLNDIVHPAVRRAALEWIEERGKCDAAPFLVLEAALLIEGDYGRICDEMWYVRADEAVRRERLRSSRGYSDKRIDDMFASQKSDKWYEKYCSYVIDNSKEGPQELYGQIDKGLKEHGIL